MNKSILLVVTTTVLLLTSCCGNGNQEKSHLLGNTPNVARELIEERIKLSTKLDKARAAHKKDDALYLRTRDKEIVEEYYIKFAAAAEEIIGNKLTAEAPYVPYKITSQPTISKSVYDTTFTCIMTYGLQFDYSITTTEDLTPNYFCEKEGWLYTVYSMVVSKNIGIGARTKAVKFNLGDAAMNKDVVPTIPAGSEATSSYVYLFPTNGVEEQLHDFCDNRELRKIVFITKSDFDCVNKVQRLLMSDEQRSFFSFSFSKRSTKKATDIPKYYDVPYVVSTYPENGAVIDSTLTHVRIKFSQPMHTGIQSTAAVDDKSALSIFAEKERTHEERESLTYWEDPYTYVLTIDTKLESGKKYGVRVPTSIFQAKNDYDYSLKCEGDCEVVFTVK